MIPAELDRILEATDLHSILSGEVAATIVNISSSGCLLESTSRVEVGTTGVLRLRRDGRHYADHIQVTRCSPVIGSNRYLIGAQFLWIPVPGESSLRGVTSSLESQHRSRATFRRLD